MVPPEAMGSPLHRGARWREEDSAGTPPGSGAHVEKVVAVEAAAGAAVGVKLRFEVGVAVAAHPASRVRLLGLAPTKMEAACVLSGLI